MPNSSFSTSREHWQNVYRHKDARSVSWFRPHLDVSMELLRQAGLNARSRLIDVGGGASTLVDDLLAMGVTEITVLDLSEGALGVARERLDTKAVEVRWLVSDILKAELPEGSFDYWHDRALFHFLTADTDARQYADIATRAVVPGGYAVIGGFASGGPESCSGLPVARRSGEQVADLFAPGFILMEERCELHRTPGEEVQAFTYVLLRRVIDPGRSRQAGGRDFGVL